MSAPANTRSVRWDEGGLERVHAMLGHHPAVAPIALLDDPGFKRVMEQFDGVVLLEAPDGELFIPLVVAEILRRLLLKAGALDDGGFTSTMRDKAGSQLEPIVHKKPRTRQWAALEKYFPDADQFALPYLGTILPHGCSPGSLEGFVQGHTPGAAELEPGDWQTIRSVFDRLEDPVSFAAWLMILAEGSHQLADGEMIPAGLEVFFRDQATPVIVRLNLRGSGRSQFIDGREETIATASVFFAFQEFLEVTG